MQQIEKLMLERAEKLLASKQVQAVLGWARGDFYHDCSPAYFEKSEQLTNFVYNNFCGSNLSKYLIANSKKDEKIAVFLKVCDSYSFNQLLKENRIIKEKVLTIAIPCCGMLDINKLKQANIRGLKAVKNNQEEIVITTTSGEHTVYKAEFLLDKCLVCKGKTHRSTDEAIGADIESYLPEIDKYAKLQELERLTTQERFEFWQAEFSKCIRCNACRDICPACSCEKCIFDNPNSEMASKANCDASEEQLYHLVRAFHVAGRCTDCGECSRVCPQGITLHLINRKIIKDLNEFFGEYQAGEDLNSKSPLLDFSLEDSEAILPRKENR